jgi:hypothetical protein
VGPLLVVALLAFLACTFSPEDRALRSLSFLSYYSLLLVSAFATSARSGAAAAVALVLVGAGYGLVAECLGAGCGLWEFTSRWPTIGANGPPLWLVLVSWPIETMTHYGISGVVTREPVDVRAGASVGSAFR